MQNISIYCLTMDPSHESKILNLNFIPVGLGEEKFSNNFLTDKKGENISFKNKFYGEYTFHYWLWKNHLDKINTNWIGFCQYRKFFVKQKINNELNKLTFKELNNYLLKQIDENDNLNYDCILGDLLSVNDFRFTKFVKKNILKFIKQPSLIFNKKKRNIKLHFDIFHGEGNLDKAIDVLDEKERDGFREYVEKKTNFHPHNMFICKKEYLVKYYEIIFPWLNKCEKLFGFELQGYGMRRIYGFLAERFLSYWFSKNCNVKKLPILVKDLSDYKNL